MNHTKRPDFTMDDFRAEMRRRGVPGGTTKQPSPPTPDPAPDPDLDPPRVEEEHGNTIVRLVPCGVHPLHSVKIRANGSRSGCPMCEMQIEDLCRVPAAPPRTPRDHAPMITLGRTRISGCTCGWRTSPGTTDSDDAYSMHAAMVLR
jgi:hypothetical protein